jgi:hypothetical protein
MAFLSYWKTLLGCWSTYSISQRRKDQVARGCSFVWKNGFTFFFLFLCVYFKLFGRFHREKGSGRTAIVQRIYLNLLKPILYKIKIFNLPFYPLQFIFFKKFPYITFFKKTSFINCPWQKVRSILCYVMHVETLIMKPCFAQKNFRSLFLHFL